MHVEAGSGWRLYADACVWRVSALRNARRCVTWSAATRKHMHLRHDTDCKCTSLRVVDGDCTQRRAFGRRPRPRGFESLLVHAKKKGSHGGELVYILVRPEGLAAPLRDAHRLRRFAPQPATSQRACGALAGSSPCDMAWNIKAPFAGG